MTFPAWNDDTDAPDDRDEVEEHEPVPPRIERGPDDEAKRAIEAVVLAATEPVEARFLAELVELSATRVEELCAELACEYEEERRGFALARVAGGYRYQTHADVAPYVERFVLEGQHVRLSGAALETLAIVAYKQPIARGQISAIRGVNVEATLQTLVARGYVADVGRDPGPGLAVLYGTTASFLERLGLDSLDDLPPLGDFVPDAGIVEALERGLRVCSDPALDDELSASDADRPDDQDATDDEHDDTGRERVQKILARAGFGSRRACEQLIAAGRVTVDGAVVQLGERADPLRQRLALDGVPVVTRPDLVYYVLNKPRGVVTTAHDPEGRPTVLELVPGEPRVFPVGRLDYETEGILVLTNDGDLAQVLTHPSFGVDKTYLAEVDGSVSDAALRTLRTGVELDDGPTQPARVRILSASESSGPARTALELTIHEGRNRQIRRMCDTVGLEVRRLVRTRLGPLRDPGLRPGEWRALDGSEVRALYESAHGSKQASH